MSELCQTGHDRARTDTTAERTAGGKFLGGSNLSPSAIFHPSASRTAAPLNLAVSISPRGRDPDDATANEFGRLQRRQLLGSGLKSAALPTRISGGSARSGGRGAALRPSGEHRRAQGCGLPSGENREPTARALGPILKEIAGVHSCHPSSNPPGLSMNATVRVRVALLVRVLDHPSKTEGGLVAMVQLGG
jgi:hypothetical protein